MEYCEYCYIVKGSPLAPNRHNASDITKRGAVGMNSTNYDRAVAAATGRRFKSSRPDIASHQTLGSRFGASRFSTTATDSSRRVA
jgi:hypothetical protein